MTTDPYGAQLHYKSFLLRLWREGTQSPWRASLTPIGDGEEKKFATVEAMCRYIQEQAHPGPAANQAGQSECTAMSEKNSDPEDHK